MADKILTIKIKKTIIHPTSFGDIIINKAILTVHLHYDSLTRAPSSPFSPFSPGSPGIPCNPVIPVDPGNPLGPSDPCK